MDLNEQNNQSPTKNVPFHFKVISVFLKGFETVCAIHAVHYKPPRFNQN
jgi:hypothetical protein